MTGQLKLEIATPERLVVSETVEDVILPSVEGSMGVLPGHAPLLARLESGQVSYHHGGKPQHLAVSGGYAEVLRESVTVLADTCELAEEIDVERATRAKERAEKRLSGDLSGVDVRRAEAALKRAISRLGVQELRIRS